MKRGEVWWASLPGAAGRRPVLVVQSNAFNESRLRSVVVALITSKLAWDGAPGNVRLALGEAGVAKPSVVNVSQLYTVDRARLTERMGVLPALAQQRVDAGLRLVLDLPSGTGRGVMEPAAAYAVRVSSRAAVSSRAKRGIP
jgi:mRNA interferase MazF